METSAQTPQATKSFAENLAANRERIFLTGMLFYLIFLVGLGVGMIGPSLLTLANQADVSIKKINLLFIFMPFGFLSGVYVCRYYVERNAVHRLILIALLFNALCVLLAGFMSSVILLFGVLFVLAVSQGMLEIISNVTLLKTYKQNPALYMNIMHFCFGIGAILSPVLVGWNIHYLQHIKYAYAFFAFLAFIGFGALFFIRLPAVKPTENADMGFNTYGKRRQVLIAIHLFVFFYLVVEAGYSIWIFPFMRESGLMNAAQAGFFTSVFWLLFTVFRLLGAVLSMRYDAIRIMLVHVAIVFIGVLYLILTGPSLSSLWLVNIAVGAGLSVCFPCVLAYCETDFQIPAKTVSHFFTSMTLGASLGPMFFGFLFARQSFLIFYPMLAAAVIMLVMLVFLKYLSEHYREKEEVASPDKPVTDG